DERASGAARWRILARRVSADGGVGVRTMIHLGERCRLRCWAGVFTVCAFPGNLTASTRLSGVVGFASCPVLLTRYLSGLRYKVMRPSGRLLLGFVFDFCLSRDRSHRCRRGGKVEISRLLRDFQGSVGAGENLFSVFAGFHAPVFSMALAFASTCSG